MTRARKADGSKAMPIKNSLAHKAGKGSGGAKPVANSIAVRPGANSASKVGNSLALGCCKK